MWQRVVKWAKSSQSVKSDKHKLVKVVKSSKCEQKVVKGGGGKESKSGLSGKKW